MYLFVFTVLKNFHWDLKKYSSKIISLLCGNVSDILTKK